MPRKTIYISEKREPAYDAWALGVTQGVVPGESASARIMELIRQDLLANAHKLRKAGISVKKLKGAN